MSFFQNLHSLPVGLNTFSEKENAHEAPLSVNPIDSQVNLLLVPHWKQLAF